MAETGVPKTNLVFLFKQVTLNLGFGVRGQGSGVRGQGWFLHELGLNVGFQLLPALFIHDGNLKCKEIYETNAFQTSSFGLGSMFVRLFDRRHFCFATLHTLARSSVKIRPPLPTWVTL